MSAANQRLCPYVGLREDSNSSVGFPSHLNYCHRCQPAAPVRIGHQEEFCLGANHRACPVFSGGENRPLPKEIRARDVRVKPPVWIFVQRTVIASVLLTALIVVFLGRAPQKRGGSASPALPTTQVTPSASNTPFVFNLLKEASATPTLPPTPTATPTLHLPRFGSATPTQSPTVTPSVTPVPLISKHRLDVPIGTARKFVIRRLSYNEKLEGYIQQYSTSFKAVQAINYFSYLKDTMQRDGLVIFPVGFTDVSGMHVLQAYQVTEADRGMNYETLAHRFKVRLEIFQEYNGIADPAERPLVGEYYLIPLRRIIP